MGNKQPGGLGFKKRATSDDIVAGKDLSGVCIAITGTSSGIGTDTARVFFERGATVFCFNRNIKKADDAHKVFLDACEKKKESIVEGGRIVQIQCDLSSQESVRNSVQKLITDHPETRFDFVFANAGVMHTPKGFTVDGFETQIGINHFGHFTWVLSLLPLVKEPGRIINVSSIAHKFAGGRINFKDMHFYNRGYGEGYYAYAQSKIANIYFTRELQRLLKKSEKNILVLTLHPGSIHSGLGKDKAFTGIGYTILGVFGYNKTVPQGAATQVLCALSDKITEGGGYYDDCQLGKSTKLSQDAEIARKFFKVSLLDTGMRYPFEVDEDINNLEAVESSRPENWKEAVEKMMMKKKKIQPSKQKKKVEEEEEVEGEEDDEEEEEIKVVKEEKKSYMLQLCEIWLGQQLQPQDPKPEDVKKKREEEEAEEKSYMLNLCEIWLGQQDKTEAGQEVKIRKKKKEEEEEEVEVEGEEVEEQKSYMLGLVETWLK